MATSTSSAESIFVGGVSRRLSASRDNDVPWTPPAITPAQREVDDQLITILDAPLLMGETAMAGFQRKELALIGVLAKLSPVDAKALHFRLANPLGSDELAKRFMRLAVDRRTRLLNFVADTRRRLAMGGK